jgi:uncharacterized protein YlxW (UPF0749 family)
MSTNQPMITAQILELITGLVGSKNAPADLSERIKNKLNAELSELVGKNVNVDDNSTKDNASLDLEKLAKRVEDAQESVEQAKDAVEQAKDELAMALNNLETELELLGKAVSKSNVAAHGVLIVGKSGISSFNI